MIDINSFKVGDLVVFNYEISDTTIKEIKKIEDIKKIGPGIMIMLDFAGNKYFRLAEFYHRATKTEIIEDKLRKMFVS
jgi:hypothetical protein